MALVQGWHTQIEKCTQCQQIKLVLQLLSVVSAAAPVPKAAADETYSMVAKVAVALTGCAEFASVSAGIASAVVEAVTAAAQTTSTAAEIAAAAADVASASVEVALAAANFFSGC